VIDLDNLAADERAELLAALLAWRDAGEQRPLIPIYGDVDGDGVPDFVGLDSFGGLAVVSGATLADSTAAHDDAGEVDVPELGGPLPVEESEDDEPKPALGPALASAVTLSNTPGTAAAAIRRPFARIDGWPVAIGIVPDLLALKAWFKQATGFNLIVSSGIRTYAEQEAIFRQRYTRTPGGRRVYDVRYWQGVPWYRVSAAGTVAAPGSSNHETGRSLDLRDDGPDPGVASSFNTQPAALGEPRPVQLHPHGEELPRAVARRAARHRGPVPRSREAAQHQPGRPGRIDQRWRAERACREGRHHGL
jgi:hypothetical protein